MRYNDPVYHKPLFLKALDIAVVNGDLTKRKADEMKKEYIQDLKERK